MKKDNIININYKLREKYMKKYSKKIVNILKRTYPDAKCSLDFETPFEMVVAVMLSAQCTDDRVNKTTPNIFDKYSTPEDFASIDIEKLEMLIHPCGFYKNKAKNIKACAKMILEKYGGEVPKTMEELMELPGVGRKSANVVMLEAFGDAQGIAVDTHCKRIANKLGLSDEKEPEKIEKDLLEIFDKEDYKDINHLFIWHGRNTCVSRSPKCEKCVLNELCRYYKENK